MPDLLLSSALSVLKNLDGRKLDGPPCKEVGRDAFPPVPIVIAPVGKYELSRPSYNYEFRTTHNIIASFSFFFQIRFG
jgi:hypothetical protein